MNRLIIIIAIFIVSLNQNTIFTHPGNGRGYMGLHLLRPIRNNFGPTVKFIDIPEINKKAQRIEPIEFQKKDFSQYLSKDHKNLNKIIEKVSKEAKSHIENYPALRDKINRDLNDPKTLAIWQNDWNKYWYHHYGWWGGRWWNPALFIELALMSPWTVFPTHSYDHYVNTYPVCTNVYKDLTYPCYWDHGYAKEIGLAQYISEGKSEDAIQKINDEIDKLKNEIDELEQTESNSEKLVKLRAKQMELDWYLQDIKKLQQPD